MSEKEATLIKTLERGRAKFAYQCAKEGSNIEKKSEYLSYARKIPMLIKTNGLGATLAYIKSKSNSDKSKAGYAYHLIYQQIEKWLNQDEKRLLKKENTDLLEAIISLDSGEYRALTIEVLAFFNWLKRFAEGLIKDEKEKQTQSNTETEKTEDEN